MINDFLLHSLETAKIPYRKDLPLAPKTTFKIGNTADLFISPENTLQLQTVLEIIQNTQDNFFILGGGSNIVFPDQPYHSIIISTEKLNEIIINDEKYIEIQPPKVNQTGQPVTEVISNTVFVTCGCGTPMSAFVSFCTKNNLSGAEEFAGLPGTIGGAIYMNARCFEKSISDILYQTSFLTVQKDGKTKIQKAFFDKSKWDYKKSPFQTNLAQDKKIILSATFALKQKAPADQEKIEADCKKFIAQRVDKGHFKYPSAGSVFKNNHTFGKPSGKLIDECGLKGRQIGGAQIAPFHGNFIINVDHAKASDVEALVELAKSQVKEKFNFDLEPEIIFLKNSEKTF